VRPPLCFLLLLISSLSFGQDSLFRKLIPRHTVKFSPNHLINFYPTIQFAYEVRIKSRFSVQLDGGYVLNFNVNNNTEYQNKRGIKAKVEMRYYFFPSERSTLVYYGAVELYRNVINFDRQLTTQECFDLACNHTYSRQRDYTVNYRETGFGLKIGFTKYFHRFLIDLNSGWIVGFPRYADPYADAGFDDVITGWTPFIIDETQRVTFLPVLGVRFGYRIQ
jgi:Protein of unknown function (DUF3575)